MKKQLITTKLAIQKSTIKNLEGSQIIGAAAGSTAPDVSGMGVSCYSCTCNGGSQGGFICRILYPAPKLSYVGCP